MQVKIHELAAKELDEAIAKSLATQRKLATDAKREPIGTFNIIHFKQLLTSEKEILRSISYMHHAYKMSPNSKKLFSSMDFLHDFHDKVCDALQEVATCIEKREPAKSRVILPDLQLVKNTIGISSAHFQSNDMTYANTFLFCTEVLITQMKKLVVLVTEINT